MAIEIRVICQYSSIANFIICILLKDGWAEKNSNSLSLTVLIVGFFS